jgi:metal-sulfur cluster biosynthetic enzyme
MSETIQPSIEDSGAPEPVEADAAEAGKTEAVSGDGEPRPNGAITREEVLEALKNVNDPELGINIVDLGLVYDVTIEGETVHITYTLTTMGCPIGPLIEAQMSELLTGVEGVDKVDAEMVLRPPWTPEMMSEEAKAALGYF